MAISSIFTRRKGHPYWAESLADLTIELRQLAEQSLKLDDPVITIFVLLLQSVPKKLGGLGNMRSVPEQTLLFTTRGVLHILGANLPKQPAQATYLQGKDLLYAHLSLILLYGRLELYGVANDTSMTIIVDYNIVSHHLVQPCLYHLLFMVGRPIQSEKSNDGVTDTLLEKIERRPLKIRNGLKNYPIQPNEGLLVFVFQPRISKRYWRAFRRLIAPTSLITLTDRELILVEEVQTDATSFGYDFIFCPRIDITEVDTRPNGAWQDVHVRLAKGQVPIDRQLMVKSNTALAWQTLWLSHAQ